MIVPIVVVPSLKVTVPPGRPPNSPVMVAVKVTACPLDDGFAVEVRVVVVGAWFTVRITAADGLELKSVDPG